MNLCNPVTEIPVPEQNKGPFKVGPLPRLSAIGARRPVRWCVLGHTLVDLNDAGTKGRELDRLGREMDGSAQAIAGELGGTLDAAGQGQFGRRVAEVEGAQQALTFVLPLKSQHLRMDLEHALGAVDEGGLGFAPVQKPGVELERAVRIGLLGFGGE